jgi:hypothetical protein
MTRKGFLLAGVVVAVLAASAGPVLAQQTEVSDVVEGAGIKVGEGTVIHPVLGVESGLVYNVFYEEGSASPKTSGLLRVIGEIAVGSLPPERLAAPEEQEESTRNYGDLAFRAELHAQYEEYLSGSELIRSHRNLAFAALARGLVYPHRTWQFGFEDDIRRETRPTNFESTQDTDRIINRVGLQLRYRPMGRALSGTLSFNNTIDYFEDDDQQFANRMANIFGLEVAWQLFPVTRLYSNVSFGFVGGFGDASTRPSSMPLRINAGIQTALTVKSSVGARVGFAKGFYDTGPDFTMVTGGLRFGYRFSPQGRLSLAYDYDFQDSINANYYSDHAIIAKIDQIIRQFGLTAATEVRFRHYAGIIMEIMPVGGETSRDDIIFSATFSGAYNFRHWIAATLDYRFTTDQTDFRYIPEAGITDDPSFTRHQIMAGVRAAY